MALLVKNTKSIDRFFLAMVVILATCGFVVFLSASLGLLAQGGATFGGVATRQAISLLIGIAAFYIFSKIDSVKIRKWSLFILIGSIVVNLLLFIPAISIYHGGASRWIDLGPISFQPSELLKIAFIIYLAAWIYFAKDKIKDFKYGLLPYLIITSILGILLLTQSDTDTLVIIACTGIVMLLIAGLPWKHLLWAILFLMIIVAGVVALRPYALKRVQTFLNHGQDEQGAGYQINQSLIAIGSGQFAGRGFGQSIQKFGYLPQPTDDSIFAVAGEEFGFLGGTVIIIIYLLYAISIFRIGSRATDNFGAFVAIGVGILVITESFLNMAAMLGLIPLSGVPLLFISHGGTALIIILAANGVVANISKH
jgi:cell division protein FtsW